MVLALCLLVMSVRVEADVFHLKAGGQIEGTLVDRGSEGEYVVKNLTGVVITLERGQVHRVEEEDKVDREYDRRSREMPDTLESHREMADWCKENRLSQEAKHHLRRVMELDPQDPDARLALGFQKHQGRWMTREDIMQQRGMELYKGKYYTPQAVALMQEEESQEQAEADWLRNLRLWRRWLENPRRSLEAEQNIVSIRDPLATVAVVKVLEQENDPEIRELLIETLAELRHPLAVIKLVDLSLDEDSEFVRHQCLDYLLARNEPISVTPYVSALDPRKNSNEIINRAGEALKMLNNPRAISPLIDALVTTHKYRDSDAPQGNMNVAFGRNGQSSPFGGMSRGGGMTMGGGPKVVHVDHKNTAVRLALVELSGGLDFEFDEKAWRRWYINDQIQDFVDTRRDQ